MMNRSMLTLLALLVLPACAATNNDVAAEAQSAAQLTGAGIAHMGVNCDQPLPVAEGKASWTVEGFGGADEQLIITQRQPMKRCAPAVTQSRTATLDVAR
jgi:hypothetical protein